MFNEKKAKDQRDIIFIAGLLEKVFILEWTVVILIKTNIFLTLYWIIKDTSKYATAYIVLSVNFKTTIDHNYIVNKSNYMINGYFNKP